MDNAPFPPRRAARKGIAAVEFALVAGIFFTVVFGIVELARIMYMYNTLADVTRSAAHAAANIDWRNTAELERAKQRAVLRDTPGMLPFGAPITEQYVRIDYMALRQQGSTLVLEAIPAGQMPTCPGRNRHNCLRNPYGGSASAADTCVRLVRARICAPGSADCDHANYQTMIPLPKLMPLNVSLPVSTTIANAESLGYRPGDPVCP